MKRLLLLFGVCGTVYVLLELIYRGRSHISMFFAGGISAVGIFLCCNCRRMKNKCLLLKCAMGSGIITAVEFLTGVAVNLWMQLQVWDYSAMPMNLLGQICLPFSLIWFALTPPILGIGHLLCGSYRSKEATKREMPASPLSSGE
ncbi:MAG: hypothetical protein IKV50_02665 [Clostridia bacterium]|nr:hypothetical protein [Clostridia bacterium]